MKILKQYETHIMITLVLVVFGAFTKSFLIDDVEREEYLNKIWRQQGALIKLDQELKECSRELRRLKK